MSTNIFGMFDSEDFKSMEILIDRLEKSPFDYLKLENDDVRIVISKNGILDVEEGAGKPVATIKGSSGNVSAVVTDAQEHAGEAKAAPVEEEAAATATKAEVVEREGVVIVRSPSYGLFYAQSAPGEPPYVTIGSMVKEGDTVGLYEVMKVFSSIAASIDGEIIEIYVKNGEQIEPDQPLMAIKAG